ncbi:MAG: hypothetical protein ACTSXF_00835, partial [Promethearchaeota archaeon]
KMCEWYCPVSRERRNKDQMYVDEFKFEDPDGLFSEVHNIRAMGSSFTGGDPLATEDQIELTLFYIEELRREMPKDFHIHLYTAGKTFTPELAEALSKAGLNEIRFHPEREDFHRIEYALNKGMDVGAEVPVIPTAEGEKYILDLIDYMENIGADFVNLNEFEMVETNATNLMKRGFKLKEGSIASVEGSEEMAIKILNELPEYYRISVHYCPASLKDGVQLRNRYKRRAETIKKDYEEVTDDGTLIYLRVEGQKPEISKFMKYLKKNLGVPQNMMELLSEHDDIPSIVSFKSNKREGENEEPIYYLHLPFFLSEEKAFIKALKKMKLNAGLVEILPFRGAYSEICEYTPLT